ncbi:thiol:disulfide interchange protein DsbG [Paraburkholderia sediminicola]|uniref:thiol:disulfide interchange protein DsbG n=1 Tax=Paraburkholderia sediminicola TaxID=458836 RepID=UPI0038BC3DB5
MQHLKETDFTARSEVLVAGRTAHAGARLIAVSVALSVVAYTHSAASTASDAASALTSTLPAPMQALVAHGVMVGKSFVAEAGLTGWIVTRQGHTGVVYTTPDRQHLIVGSLVDATGRDMTPVYAATYAPRPDLASLYKQLDGTRYVAQGTAASKKVIYVFFDPNCVFCHFAWIALQPYVKAGLQVRWVPVGFLKPTSATRAAAILEAKAPVQALQFNEERFVPATEDGGLNPVSTIRPETLRTLTANRALMDAFDSNGAPTIVWKDSHGVVQAKSGMPPLSALSAMTGLPEQPETDRDLDRFR